ncbi:hypothetical protein E4O05_09000 [Treponema sp. OMZ 787]|uniref:hypothetical protein n=1 Tax=Treponema sp. OMZ 787 TaxID=2563669 RepID=UPI0020A3E0EB|nr:hypothetical protein [Treponema sp. OMZ 787]UTC61681.1 hypothetical protein E4O05_09000 [Treponema sp. OMZ 787]
MKKRFFHQFSLVLSFFIAFNLFGQENSDIPLSQRESNIEGLWENGCRFIEFSKKDDSLLDMRIVLKPYYRFVYEKTGTFSASLETQEDSKSLFYLKIRYPYVKNTIVFPVCVENDFFFTSFYKKIPYEVQKEDLDDFSESKDENSQNSFGNKKIALDGFWIEQGSPDGILLYPNDPPESVDAYFFMGDDYIRFRYWLDDLEYNDKKVIVKGNDGTGYIFPRLLKRGSLVYSCVTNTGSILRNYETGKFIISSDTDAEKTKGLFLTFKPLGAGPGSHAVADTYPKSQFSVLENLPLYITDDGKLFSIGEPFLMRSQVKDLDAEIRTHNSKRRPPPEPSIPIEDL